MQQGDLGALNFFQVDKRCVTLISELGGWEPIFVSGFKELKF